MTGHDTYTCSGCGLEHDAPSYSLVGGMPYCESCSIQPGDDIDGIREDTLPQTDAERTDLLMRWTDEASKIVEACANAAGLTGQERMEKELTRAQSILDNGWMIVTDSLKTERSAARSARRRRQRLAEAWEYEQAKSQDDESED